MLGTMRRRAETHHTPSDETLPCGDGSNFLGLGGGTSWAGMMLPQQQQHQPQPFQRGFLNCFFWCGGPSGNIVDEDEDLEDEEDLAVGLPDVSTLFLRQRWLVVSRAKRKETESGPARRGVVVRCALCVKTMKTGLTCVYLRLLGTLFVAVDGQPAGFIGHVLK